MSTSLYLKNANIHNKIITIKTYFTSTTLDSKCNNTKLRMIRLKVPSEQTLIFSRFYNTKIDPFIFQDGEIELFVL